MDAFFVDDGITIAMHDCVPKQHSVRVDDGNK